MPEKFKATLYLKVCYVKRKKVKKEKEYRREYEELPFNPLTLKNNLIFLSISEKHFRYCEINCGAWDEDDNTFTLWGTYKTGDSYRYEHINELLKQNPLYVYVHPPKI